MDIDPLPVIDRIKELGGNLIYQGMLSKSMNWVSPQGRFGDVLVRTCNHLHSKGMLLELGIMGRNAWEQMYDWQWKRDLINNVGGLADEWIVDCGNIVREAQPDIITVFNEPFGDLSNGESASSTFLQKYRDFIVRAIRAWRQIKPDLIGVVQGVPFWELQTILNPPFAEPNLLYALHYYYSYEGTYPPSWEKANLAYWNGDLINAKVLLEQDWLNNMGLQAAINAGVPVFFEEVGSNTRVPNCTVFLRDAIDLIRKYNMVGFTYLCNDTSRPYPSLFNSDGSLNSLGQVWVDAMKVPLPPYIETEGGKGGDIVEINKVFTTEISATAEVSVAIKWILAKTEPTEVPEGFTRFVELDIDLGQLGKLFAYKK